VADEKKFAGYICTGCGIGERLNANKLESIAKQSKMPLTRKHELLCGKEGVQMIRDDIEKEGVTHIMIAGCSRRAKVEAFSFPKVAMSRANLREGVLWVRPDTPENAETTQEMAEDYIRMASAEVRFMTVPQGSGEQPLNKNMLVVGGGVTGMTAALEAAAAGYQVTIWWRRAAALGGHLAQLYKKTPSRAAAYGVGNVLDAALPQPEDTGVEAMVAACRATATSPCTSTAWWPRPRAPPAASRCRSPPSPAAPPRSASAPSSRPAASVPYDANQLPELGYGKSKDVVTNLELEALAKAANGGAIKRPSDGKEVKSVAFVQCAGQRSLKDGHLPYCSGFCCTTSIKQAMYFKEQNPGCDATVLFTDLRTPGAAGEDFYRAGQQKHGHLLQGRGLRGGGRFQPEGEVQGPDPGRRDQHGRRPGGPRLRHGGQLRSRSLRPVGL
jgi:quinone-modifying oxidoreductase, subunit QmoB